MGPSREIWSLRKRMSPEGPGDLVRGCGKSGTRWIQRPSEEPGKSETKGLENPEKELSDRPKGPGSSEGWHKRPRDLAAQRGVTQENEGSEGLARCCAYKDRTARKTKPERFAVCCRGRTEPCNLPMITVIW